MRASNRASNCSNIVLVPENVVERKRAAAARNEQYQRTHDRYVLEERTDMAGAGNHMGCERDRDERHENKKGRNPSHQAECQGHAEYDENRSAQPKKDGWVAYHQNQIAPRCLGHASEHHLVLKEMTKPTDNED